MLNGNRIPMSAPERVIVLSPEAQTDYENIQAYTLRQWSEERWLDYEETLFRAFTLLRENPAIGSPRDDLRRGARIFPAGQHLIVYEVDTIIVRIARLLHQRMDARRALQQD